jgi:hypothetical protein
MIYFNIYEAIRENFPNKDVYTIINKATSSVGVEYGIVWDLSNGRLKGWVSLGNEIYHEETP